jgi:hypothetical protein
MSTFRHVPPPPPLPVRQRRHEVRYPAAFRAILHSARAKDALLTCDVSYRGLYVASARLLPLRELVRVGLWLPTGAGELVVHGMVVSARETASGDGRPRGMGIELYALDKGSRSAWWEAVRFARDHAAPVGA